MPAGTPTAMNGADTLGPAGIGKRLTAGDQRQEGHRATPGSMFGNEPRRLTQVRLDHVTQIPFVVIARRGAHLRKVHWQRHALDDDARKPAFLDQAGQPDFDRNFLIEAAQLTAIRTEGGGCHAEHLGRLEVQEHLRRHRTKCIAMGFINDDEAEVIPWPFVQPSADALRGGHHDSVPEEGFGVGHFDPGKFPRVSEILVGVLADQFLSIG